MGQYFSPIILKKNWKLAKQPVKMALYSWDFGNGLKLMEHSYVGNHFVQAVQHLLHLCGGKFHFVWCGDYAKDVKTHYHPNGADLYSCATQMTDEDGCDNEQYKKIRELIPHSNELHDYKYIINKTKKEYIITPSFKPNLFVINPFPILCANSCGEGGGDYNSNNEEDEQFIGRWAYDIIAVSDDKADTKGYKLIKPHFKESF